MSAKLNEFLLMNWDIKHYTSHIHITECIIHIKKKTIARDVSKVHMNYSCFGEAFLSKNSTGGKFWDRVTTFKVIPADRGRLIHSGGKSGKRWLRSSEVRIRK